MTEHKTDEALVVTDCCGRLMPVQQTLTGDVHFPDLCPACDALDGREHDRHVSCDWNKDVHCPGRDWSYLNGHIQLVNDSGIWCWEHCPMPDEECGRMAIEQNA